MATEVILGDTERSGRLANPQSNARDRFHGSTFPDSRMTKSCQVNPTATPSITQALLALKQ